MRVIGKEFYSQESMASTRTSAQNVSIAELLAVVEVPYDARIRCQAPGCGHSVYKRIHVVQQGTVLQVLGSDCFSKLFGGMSRQKPQYGGSEGRALTAEERELLLTNTAQLLERFNAEKEAAIEAQRLAQEERQRKLTNAAGPQGSLRTVQMPPSPPLSPRLVQPGATPFGSFGKAPWPWMKPCASMGYFLLKDGTGWVRVLRADGVHVLAPWPSFDVWEKALPENLGQVDLECGCYVLHDVMEAAAFLRARSVRTKVCGSRRELDAETAKGGK